MKEHLSRILGIASSIREIASARSQCCLNVAATADVARIPDFPLTPSISLEPDLVRIGLPAEISKKLSQAFSKSVASLQHDYAQKYRSACEAITSHNPGQQGLELCRRTSIAFQTSYARQINVWRSETHKLALCKLEEIRNAQPSVERPRKSSFNHEYTPLLEKYFEYNAYPCAPDRALLARKSMMTTRQIEVWFQNHRSRAKREGKVLRKLSSTPLPINLSLASLEANMPFFAIPESQRAADTNESFSDTEKSDGVPSTPPPRDVFDQISPPHAFPTTYPPSCSYDPFPNKGGTFNFPPPVWCRKPKSVPVSAQSIDVDELICEFSAKLHLREDTSRTYLHRRAPVDNEHHKHWFSATVTIAPAAPLSALIRYHGQLQPQPMSQPAQSRSPTTPVTIHPDASPVRDRLARRKPVNFTKRVPTSKGCSSVMPSDRLSRSPHRTVSSSSSTSTHSTRSTSPSSVSSGDLTTPPPSPLFNDPYLLPTPSIYAHQPLLLTSESLEFFSGPPIYGVQQPQHKLSPTAAFG